MKAAPVVAIALALVATALAGGAYYRVRSLPPAATGNPAEVDDLRSRIARLEADLAKARREPDHGSQPSAYQEPSAPTGNVADLEKRVAMLEARLNGSGRPTIDGRAQPRPSPEMVELHKKRLNDTNLTVRQRATSLGVLRTQAANKSDDVVESGLGLLSQAQEPVVRALILRNLQGAENTRLLPTVMGLLKLDADEDVRDEAARLLGEYLSKPEAKAALEAALAGDASDKVKRRAQTALNNQSK